MTHAATRKTLVFSATLALGAIAASASTQPPPPTPPKAEKGYSISVFATGVPGKYTAPDSLAVSGDHIYIGYGDGNDPTGADGKSNMIVEYSKDGHKTFSFVVIGHNDGLKVDPRTHKIWAMQNEDANPNLVIFDPKTREQRQYTFAAPPPNGGGYDDITFRNDEVYFSASNPSHNPNAEPAIVKAKFVGNVIEVTPVLEGTASATNVVTGAPVTLNLQDPDSMTLTPSNNILLDSQGDSELILIRKPGKNQSVLQIPLTSPFGTPQVDDTLFIPSDDGFMLVSDTPADTTYIIRKTAFIPGTAYSAGVGAPDSSGATPGFVGRLDLDFGQLTPIVTGLNSPHGLAFVKAHNDDDDGDDGDHACRSDKN
ncbi:MAG TPA: hypothetical protein VH139_09340 [Acidobacteriaceae bacterium]|jgi:hypothetical protein|nr:hypothetical protein [Acidobacteriaceae bacterium]